MDTDVLKLIWFARARGPPLNTPGVTRLVALGDRVK